MKTDECQINSTSFLHWKKNLNDKFLQLNELVCKHFSQAFHNTLIHIHPEYDEKIFNISMIYVIQLQELTIGQLVTLTNGD